ncbi:MAG: hypothetical protein IJ513_05535 [Bacteroidaceae bacterium]|nr:hypothetical protein [Bacteroidaceae bacterium]
MKKFLLSFFCMLGIMSYAYADEAKFDFTTPSGLTPSITDEMFTAEKDGAFSFGTSGTTFTANGVTLNTTDGSTVSRIWKAASGKYDFRVYKTATMTIAAPEGGVITAIAFDGATVSSFSANSGTVDSKNWTGAATSVVFTWASDAKTQKINTVTVTFSTDGSITPDQGGDGEGGDENEGETEVTYTTIAEVLAAGAGNAATKGTVVATYARGFLMSDETGSILVYLGSAPSVTAGDAVNVNGTTSMYGGLLQFAAGSTVEKTGTATVTHPTATVMDGAALDAFIAAPIVKYVEYTGTLTINNNYYNVAVEGATTAVGSIQYPQDAIKASLTNGSVVKVTGYTIGVSSNKYVNTMAVMVEVIEEGEEPEEPETPTETKAYTVTEALAAYVDGKQIPAIVTGYIVGAVNSAPETGSQFGAEATIATNILISDNADTNDYTECLIVQLPSGEIRSALNLVDNPGNYKKQVKITGSVEKYFKVAGLKTVTAYEFTGVTGIEKVEIRNEKSEIYDLTGRRVENITAPGIYIVDGKKVLVK